MSSKIGDAFTREVEYSPNLKAGGICSCVTSGLLGHCPDINAQIYTLVQQSQAIDSRALRLASELS